MDKQLQGKTIAIIATDGFEQSELMKPKDILEQAGATVKVLSVEKTPKEIKGWDETDWGNSVKVDGLVVDATPASFDALVLPGGVMNPDKLRQDKNVVGFVEKFVKSGKPVAAICHGPWTLIEAGIVSGRTLTSWPSLQTDLRNAGAKWVDKEVAIDGNLITSRKPDDLEAFSKAIIEAVSQQGTGQARAA
jgi:protease I